MWQRPFQFERPCGAPASGRRAFLGELLGRGDPAVAGHAALEVERAIERLRHLHVEIGDLPEMVDANVVEALLELRIDARQALQIVGLAARRVDALELRLAGEILGRRLVHRADVDATLHLAALDAVDGGARDEIRVERQRAAGVVVAGHHEVDAVGIAVGVDDGDDRDIELARFRNRDLLLVRIDHEQQVRQAAHFLDAAQRLVERVAVARELQEFLLRAALAFTGEDLVELLQAADRLRDGLPVGQRATEPAVIDVVLRRALGGVGDRLGGLPLGADEQDAAAAGDRVGDLEQRLMQQRHRLRQIENVDFVARPIDERCHLGVPAVGLVAEVHAGFKQLAHGERRESHETAVLFPVRPPRRLRTSRCVGKGP